MKSSTLMFNNLQVHYTLQALGSRPSYQKFESLKLMQVELILLITSSKESSTGSKKNQRTIQKKQFFSKTHQIKMVPVVLLSNHKQLEPSS